VLDREGFALVRVRPLVACTRLELELELQLAAILRSRSFGRRSQLGQITGGLVAFSSLYLCASFLPLYVYILQFTISFLGCRARITAN
jgi:hypothetical protein